MRRLAFAATCLLCALLAATACSLTINGVASGWYQLSGISKGVVNQNYIAGQNGVEHRDFFVFDVTGLSQPIIAASILFHSPLGHIPPNWDYGGYESPDPSEIFAIFDVSTDLDQLTAGTAGVAAFSDLGSGVSYGSKSVSATDDGGFVTVSLNPAAIADLNAALGGYFALGGAVRTLSSATEEHVFGNTYHDENSDPSNDRVLSCCTAGGGGEIVPLMPPVPYPSPQRACWCRPGFSGSRRRAERGARSFLI